MSNKKDEIKPPSESEILIHDMLSEKYSPGGRYDFDESQTTHQIFNKLQQINPSNDYDAHDVYVALKEQGYIYDNIAGEWEWLLKHR